MAEVAASPAGNLGECRLWLHGTSAADTVMGSSNPRLGTLAGDAPSNDLASAGKRAGALCLKLAQCTPQLAADNACQMDSTDSIAAGGVLPAALLDQCAMEGVAGGSTVPGVVASTPLAAGRCVSSADCGADEL
jgi:hypothetical protein